jgi:hypothetical protein
MIGAETLVHVDEHTCVQVDDLFPGMELMNPLLGTTQKVAFVLQRTLSVPHLAPRDRSRLAPVLLTQGSVTEKSPSRSLLVSPQQPVLVRTSTRRNVPTASFVTAKALVSRGQASRVSVMRDFSYYVVVTDQPGVILAHGIALKTVGQEAVAATQNVLIAMSARRPIETPFESLGRNNENRG